MNLKTFFQFFIVFIIFSVQNANAFWPWDKKYLVKANDEIISIEDLQRKLGKSHTVKDIGKKMNINIPNVDYRKILNELINDRLMIQEAVKIELNKTSDFIKTYNLTKLNLSLDMLKKEEVFDKVQISDKEIDEQFIFMNESVRIRQLFAKEREKGEALLKALTDGADFVELAKKESADPDSIKKKGGDLGFKSRGQLQKKIADVVFSLTNGKISSLIETKKGFYIIKVEEKNIPTRKVSVEERKFIWKTIFQKKEKEINNKYLANLRRNAKITINEITIKSLNVKDKFDAGKTVAAVVNGEPITRDEILLSLKTGPAVKNNKEIDRLKRDTLNILIRDKLLDMEVAKRHYEQDEKLQKQLKQTMDSFLLRLFKEKIIGGAVKLDEKEIKEYYNEHEQEFKEPDRVRLKMIKLHKQETANKVLKELKKGADFGVLAMEKSKDSSAVKRGNIGWITVNQLAPDVNEKLDEVKIGEVFGPFRGKYGLTIWRLDGREEGNLIKYSSVRDTIIKMLGRKKYQKMFDEYVSKLRLVSNIIINESVLKSFIESKKKSSSTKKNNLSFKLTLLNP